MKTVFILGAGFSAEANAPAQESLIKTIFDLHEKDPATFHYGSVKHFSDFLTDHLNIPQKMHKLVPLEDIFTPIDRCLLDNISFRDLDREELVKIRETVYYLIGRALEEVLKDSQHRYVEDFADFLVNKCKDRMENPSLDPVSVISTNWDILLDNALKNKIDTAYSLKGVVDYCCYISSYKKDDQTVKPGLEMLGAKGFNVKLLKLHGSLNWLQCPRCSRVYVDFGSKIAIRHFHDPTKCRHCANNFKSNSKSINLVSNLIMPTFLKNFSNSQYKLIWHNAGIELTEADEVIFIGYSLPQADFEMRQLLARTLRVNAKIHVVDYGIESSSKIKSLLQRYSVFLGNRKIQFHFGGTSEFLKDYLSPKK